MKPLNKAALQAFVQTLSEDNKRLWDEWEVHFKRKLEESAQRYREKLHRKQTTQQFKAQS